jgi:anti-sigma factor ChrR (cupin superfamily)
MALANLTKTVEQPPIHLHVDLRQNAFADTQNMSWAFSPAVGVHRKVLERIGGEKAVRATSLVRYAPGARFDAHIHDAGEELYVLEGVFSDDSGDFGVGSYVRNPPFSAHEPYSKNGCIIFVKLGQIPHQDRRIVRADSGAKNATWFHSGKGVRSLKLYESEHEHVALVHWPAGLDAVPVYFEHGAEMLVLKGSFKDEFGHHGQGSWLRLAPGQCQSVQVTRDSTVWIKTGHLGTRAIGTVFPFNRVPLTKMK